MSEPFLGQIGIFAFGFPPRYWVPCAGQLLNIARNQALYTLLGTTFGGDGKTTFGLPNLQGRAPVSAGQGQGLSPYTRGQYGGETAHTLTIPEMAPHRHGAATASDTSQPSAQGNYWAPNTGGNATYSATADGSMSGLAVGLAGSGEAHPNMQPYLALNVCISLAGAYPIRDEGLQRNPSARTCNGVS
jgi:microcystin-dependent protein